MIITTSILQKMIGLSCGSSTTGDGVFTTPGLSSGVSHRSDGGSRLDLARANKRS